MVKIKTYVDSIGRMENNMSENVKEKIGSVLLIFISILFPIILDGDATASVILLPMGIAGLCGKEVEDF